MLPPLRGLSTYLVPFFVATQARYLATRARVLFPIKSCFWIIITSLVSFIGNEASGLWWLMAASRPLLWSSITPRTSGASFQWQLLLWSHLASKGSCTCGGSWGVERECPFQITFPTGCCRRLFKQGKASVLRHKGPSHLRWSGRLRVT